MAAGSTNSGAGELDRIALYFFRKWCMLGIPDKYAMERGGWASNGVLKAVYQHTFSEERKQVDERIDDFFNDLLRV